MASEHKNSENIIFGTYNINNQLIQGLKYLSYNFHTESRKKFTNFIPDIIAFQEVNDLIDFYKIYHVNLVPINLYIEYIRTNKHKDKYKFITNEELIYINNRFTDYYISFALWLGKKKINEKSLVFITKEEPTDIIIQNLDTIITHEDMILFDDYVEEKSSDDYVEEKSSDDYVEENKLRPALIIKYKNYNWINIHLISGSGKDTLRFKVLNFLTNKYKDNKNIIIGDFNINYDILKNFIKLNKYYIPRFPEIIDGKKYFTHYNNYSISDNKICCDDIESSRISIDNLIFNFIKDIIFMPPINLKRFKSSADHCFLYGYIINETNKDIKDITGRPSKTKRSEDLETIKLKQILNIDKNCIDKRTEEIEFYNKYLKYKKKYLELKKNL